MVSSFKGPVGDATLTTHGSTAPSEYDDIMMGSHYPTIHISHLYCARENNYILLSPYWN